MNSLKEKTYKPAISISMKKPGIRIYKDTLHLLEDPNYILLMVNPEDYSIVISPSDWRDCKSHNIARYLFNNTKSITLYSTSLIRELKMLRPNWDYNKAYKIGGVYLQNEFAVKFDMTSAVEI